MYVDIQNALKAYACFEKRDLEVLKHTQQNPRFNNLTLV